MHVAGLSISFGARTLFEGVSFRLQPRERLAVVGRNGAGKTTLLRCLTGEVTADAGSVALPKGATVALHDQRPPLGRDLTLQEYVAEGLAGVRRAEEDLAALERRMGSGESGPEILSAYARAQAALERAGGYAWQAWLERVLRGLGIGDEELGRPLGSFSGGELTRASLARALVSRPDVLLLDEPTNHLDMSSMEWLEETLADLEAAVVLVSHDRWFLESLATSVLELEGGRAKLWPVGYSAFRRARAEALSQQAAAAEAQAAEIARLERFVARWRAGTRSRQARSRAKVLERIVPVEPPTRQRSLAFGFPKAERSARVVVEADDLGVAAGNKPLVRGASFAIERGQRVAVVGPNGAGKTSLVETLIGRRRSAAGRVALGHKVEVGYFSQHAAELASERTILETVQAGTAVTSTQARTLLGRFLFSGDVVDRRVETLSGGERRRLSLVQLIARGGNCLVLDEPTNHLDVESREALEEAIASYDGTVVIVSHDRALIDAVATRTLALEAGGVVERPGGYSDLLRAREVAVSEVAVASLPTRRARRRLPSSASPPPRKEVARLEAHIAGLEAEIAEIETQLADPVLAADRELVARRGERHRAAQEELSWLFLQWERAAEAAG